MDTVMNLMLLIALFINVFLLVTLSLYFEGLFFFLRK